VNHDSCALGVDAEIDRANSTGGLSMCTGYRALGAAFAAAMAIAFSSPGHAQAWQPERPVEIIVPTAAGGGNDKTARLLGKLLQARGINNVVVNKTGGSGAIAYHYVIQRRSDPHTIGIAQAGLLSNQITGRSAFGHADMSILANVGFEPSALAVRAESAIKSATAMFETLRNDPKAFAVSIGSTPGGTSHLALSRAVRTIGIDPKQLKTVSFNGSSEAVAAVLGGHIDMMIAAINNVVPHQQSGKMRSLLVTADKRLSGDFSSVPTLRDAGIDVVAMGWTAVIAPPNLTAAQIAWWEESLAQIARTEAWRKYLEFNYWQNVFQGHAEATAYLRHQYEQTRAGLVDLGLAK
jgi:putative tricarboxylic transport membrane protein